MSTFADTALRKMTSMKHVGEIEIRRLLPLVFKGMEASEAIVRSEIWLAESFTFRRGCRMCIRAESGGGKSSLLSFIYGNRSDFEGDILFDGVNSRSLSIDQWCTLRQSQIALLPQEMRIFPELTVRQNIELKNRLTNHKTDAQIRQLLARLGIEDKLDVPAAKSSIGQQQRVALIRTVCQPFDFIFLDEPVSHLDEHNNRLIAEIVEEEAGAQGAGVVTTSVGNPLLLANPQFIDL